MYKSEISATEKKQGLGWKERQRVAWVKCVWKCQVGITAGLSSWGGAGNGGGGGERGGSHHFSLPLFPQLRNEDSTSFPLNKTAPVKCHEINICCLSFQRVFMWHKAAWKLFLFSKLPIVWLVILIMKIEICKEQGHLRRVVRGSLAGI